MYRARDLASSVCSLVLCTNDELTAFVGVLAAIVWFPIGIACCLLDRRVKCARCGMTLDEGLCA